MRWRTSAEVMAGSSPQSMGCLISRDVGGSCRENPAPGRTAGGVKDSPPNVRSLWLAGGGGSGRSTAGSGCSLPAQRRVGRELANRGARDGRGDASKKAHPGNNNAEAEPSLWSREPRSQRTLITSELESGGACIFIFIWELHLAVSRTSPSPPLTYWAALM